MYTARLNPMAQSHTINCWSVNVTTSDDLIAGLNWFIRKMAARGKPDTEWEALEIGAGGDPVLLRQRNLSKCKPSEITFRIGEPFKDEIFNGKKIVVNPNTLFELEAILSYAVQQQTQIAPPVTRMIASPTYPHY